MIPSVNKFPSNLKCIKSALLSVSIEIILAQNGNRIKQITGQLAKKKFLVTKKFFNLMATIELQTRTKFDLKCKYNTGILVY